MKLLVGILYYIENEFDQCVESIKRQTYQTYDYFVIEKCPNKKAHDKLYAVFMDNSNNYDLFIKIDADMVLSRHTFFEELVEYFSKNKEVPHLQIQLDDWFTQRRIMGLHAYKNTHKWILNNEAYFVDIVDAPGQPIVNDSTELAPAAIHCPDPSPFQAFHFGVHKAVKVLQRGQMTKQISYSHTHWKNFVFLESHYHRTKEPRLGLAVAGFLHAIRYLYDSSHVDYSSSETRQAFDYYQSMSQKKIEQVTYSLGLYALPFLPCELRYELAIYHNKDDKNFWDIFSLLINYLRT